MSGPIRRFDPSESQVPGEADPSTAEQADAMLAARELEALASEAQIRPSDGFEDRIMAAIALEPAPRLVARPRSAVRGGVIGSFLATIRDSWGVATTGGRPMAVRAQAFAFVLLVAVAATAFGGVGAMGVGALFDGDRSPAPSVQPLPTESVPATPLTPRYPSIEPSGSPSASPSGTAEPSETAEPTETAEATETSGATETADAETPRPTNTPRPTETLEPGETPHGTDDSSGSGSGSGSGSSGDDSNDH